MQKRTAAAWRVSDAELALLLREARKGTISITREGQDPYGLYNKKGNFIERSLVRELNCKDGTEAVLAEYVRVYDQGQKAGEGGISGAAILGVYPGVTTRLDMTLRQLLSNRSTLKTILLKKTKLTTEVPDATIYETFNEILCGYFLNTLVLRRLTPGFVLLIDWFRAADEKEAEEACKVPTSIPGAGRGTRAPGRRRKAPGGKKEIAFNTEYIISERAEILASEFLELNANIETIRACILQLAHLLDVSWRTSRFVHYDLHLANAMLTRPLAEERGIKDTWLLANDPTTNAYDTWYKNDQEKPQAKTPPYFRLSVEDTDGGRLIKLIDFGRSRMRVSSDPGNPVAVDRVLPPEDLELGLLGIRRDDPSPFYDMRRIVYDVVANVFEGDEWNNIESGAKETEWNAWREFCIRAMDVPYMVAYFKENQTTIENEYFIEQTFGDAEMPDPDEKTIAEIQQTLQSEWYDTLPENSEQANQWFLDKLFGMREDDPISDYLYHLFREKCVWRDDPRDKKDVEQLAKYHDDGWNKALELSPQGLTPRDALNHAFFSPLRTKKQEVQGLMQKHAGAEEWLMPANLLNLTLAQAGVPEIIKEGRKTPTLSTLPSATAVGAQVSASNPASCAHCGIPKVREACAACRRAFYCSTRCARAAWNGGPQSHATTCPFDAIHHPPPISSPAAAAAATAAAAITRHQ